MKGFQAFHGCNEIWQQDIFYVSRFNFLSFDGELLRENRNFEWNKTSNTITIPWTGLETFFQNLLIANFRNCSILIMNAPLSRLDKEITQ